MNTSRQGCGPDAGEHGWANGAWSVIFEEVLASDILVLAGPIWLGDNSSVMKRVHERLYGGCHLLNGKRRCLCCGRVGGRLITGNEDRVKHCAQNMPYTVQRIGCTFPSQADAGWTGEAGPRAVVSRPGIGWSGERLHQPQHDRHDMEPDGSGEHAAGGGRRAGARKYPCQLGRGVPT